MEVEQTTPFEAKKAWVLAATKRRRPPTRDGVVVSFDEWGRSRSSRTPAPADSPGASRAASGYHRIAGTRKLLGASDVGADRLWGHVESRRITGEVVLEFLKDIRRRYPAEVTSTS